VIPKHPNPFQHNSTGYRPSSITRQCFANGRPSVATIWTICQSAAQSCRYVRAARALGRAFRSTVWFMLAATLSPQSGGRLKTQCEEGAAPNHTHREALSKWGVATTNWQAAQLIPLGVARLEILPTRLRTPNTSTSRLVTRTSNTSRIALCAAERSWRSSTRLGSSALLRIALTP
jgi:hypothetical protein